MSDYDDIQPSFLRAKENCFIKAHWVIASISLVEWGTGLSYF